MESKRTRLVISHYGTRDKITQSCCLIKIFWYAHLRAFCEGGNATHSTPFTCHFGYNAERRASSRPCCSRRDATTTTRLNKTNMTCNFKAGPRSDEAIFYQFIYDIETRRITFEAAKESIYKGNSAKSNSINH